MRCRSIPRSAPLALLATLGLLTARADSAGSPALLAINSALNASYNDVLGSLIYVASHNDIDDKKIKECSGAIVSADTNSSIAVTAAHCLVHSGRLVVLYGFHDPAHLTNIDAQIIKTGNPSADDLSTSAAAPDVGFIRLNKPLPPLGVESTSPSIVQADQLMLVGFPQKSLADHSRGKRLVPRHVEGSFSLNENFMSYTDNVSSDRGDSGGPMVDMGTGNLIGIRNGALTGGDYVAPNKSVVRVQYNNVNWGTSYVAIRAFAKSGNTVVALSAPTRTQPAAPAADVSKRIDVIQGRGPYSGPSGFDRGFQSVMHCGNDPESWVRTSASLQVQSGVLDVTMQLETDSAAAGPRGRGDVTLRDAQNQTLAKVTFGDIAMGGRLARHAVQRNFTKTYQLPTPIAGRTASLYVQAFCTGSMNQLFGIDANSTIQTAGVSGPPVALEKIESAPRIVQRSGYSNFYVQALQNGHPVQALKIGWFDRSAAFVTLTDVVGVAWGTNLFTNAQDGQGAPLTAYVVEPNTPVGFGAASAVAKIGPPVSYTYTVSEHADHTPLLLQKVDPDPRQIPIGGWSNYYVQVLQNGAPPSRPVKIGWTTGDGSLAFVSETKASGMAWATNLYTWKSESDGHWLAAVIVDPNTPVGFTTASKIVPSSNQKATFTFGFR